MNLTIPVRLHSLTHISACIVPLILAAAACKSGKKFDPEYFGKAISLPGDLAKLKVGMTMEQIKAAGVKIVMIEKRPDKETEAFESPFSDVEITPSMSDGTLREVRFRFENTGVKEMLEKAWGPGTPDEYNPKSVAWRNEAGGVKGKIDCSERSCYLYASPFTPLTADFFGKEVGIPAAFAGYKFNATAQEAQAALPGFPSITDKLVPAGPDGVSANVPIDRDSKRNHRLWLQIPRSASAMLEANWGAPKKYEYLGANHLVWFNPGKGVRASLEMRPETGKALIDSSVSLTYTQYLPVAQLLGDGPDIAMLKQPVLGKSPADVKAAYAANVKGEGESMMLVFPPTDFDTFETRVNFFIREDIVKSVRFTIPFEHQPSIKDELFAALKKKWGEPTQDTAAYDKPWIFTAGTQKYKVTENTISKGWTIEQEIE